jgi:hypothetical protein
VNHHAAGRERSPHVTAAFAWADGTTADVGTSNDRQRSPLCVHRCGILLRDLLGRRPAAASDDLQLAPSAARYPAKKFSI